MHGTRSDAELSHLAPPLAAGSAGQAPRLNAIAHNQTYSHDIESPNRLKAQARDMRQIKRRKRKCALSSGNLSAVQ
jgi:hypothetical protein